MVWIESVHPFSSETELESWEKEFIDFLFTRGVLKFGEFTLKSKRRSPTFLNFGDVSDGEGIAKLGHFYAEFIKEKIKEDFGIIVGPAYKGIPLAVVTSAALASEHGKNVCFTFDRKEEKVYGEATGVSKVEAAKKIFVGHIPKDGDKVLLIDDVITTGKTKIEEIEKLKSVADVNLVGLVIAGNRQELDEDGNDAISELSTNLHLPVYSMLDVVSRAVPYLIGEGKVDEPTRRRLAAYTRTYGTENTKRWCRSLKFIERDKGIIPACDVSLNKFEELVRVTADIDSVVAYKIPAISGRKGWETWISIARKYTQKPLIYDHQKASTDIPDTGKDFMAEVKAAGFDAVILFPESGPSTQWEWVHSAFEQDLEVLAGGEMTHPRLKASEGGYINDDALIRMYILAAKAGVNNFVVPGNKPDRIELYKSEIEKAVPGIMPAFYSPGLVAQSGKISEATKVAGNRWYGIVGRGIYAAPDMREAALEHVSQLS
jgi:orotate phosphoribosyltransferase